jgi:hypothetical protein
MIVEYVYFILAFVVGAGAFLLGRSAGMMNSPWEIAIGACVTASIMGLFYWLTSGRQHAAHKK